MSTSRCGTDANVDFSCSHQMSTYHADGHHTSPPRHVAVPTCRRVSDMHFVTNGLPYGEGLDTIELLELLTMYFALAIAVDNLNYATVV